MTHDIAVMYAGRIVERAPTAELFASPQHPYTWGLLRSIPRLDASRDEQLVPIEGRPPSLINLPSGCSFHPRCPFVREAHKRVEPTLEPVDGDPRARGRLPAARCRPGASCGGGWPPARRPTRRAPWCPAEDGRRHERRRLRAGSRAVPRVGRRAGRGARPRQGLPDHDELPRAPQPRRGARRRRRVLRRPPRRDVRHRRARAAAASRPPRGSSCACSTPRPARSASRARRSPSSPRARSSRCGARCR